MMTMRAATFTVTLAPHGDGERGSVAAPLGNPAGFGVETPASERRTRTDRRRGGNRVIELRARHDGIELDRRQTRTQEQRRGAFAGAVMLWRSWFGRRGNRA